MLRLMNYGIGDIIEDPPSLCELLRTGRRGKPTITECVNFRIVLALACLFGPLRIRHLRRSPRESNPVATSFFGGQALTGLTAGLFTGMTGWFFDN